MYPAHGVAHPRLNLTTSHPTSQNPPNLPSTPLLLPHGHRRKSKPPQTPPPISLDNIDMADISNCSFTGKPEDQDPQDFMNRLERIILIKTGLTETEKVRFLELSLKAKSPATAWFLTLNDGNKKSFATAHTAFEVRWPVKATAEKTTAEKQALLDEIILKISDLGKRVAASAGAEEELSHIVWADKVERLAGDIPDTNNLLVVSTRKNWPNPSLGSSG